ncbi:hypothetical protein ACKLNR_002158 [Fusarium oxysporum f. sp. zingiberi]
MAKLEEIVMRLAKASEASSVHPSIAMAEDTNLPSPQVVEEGSDAAYHGETSWEAVFKSIHDIQSVLSTQDEPDHHGEPETLSPASDIAMGGISPIAMSEILNSVPSRQEADVLVKAYFLLDRPVASSICYLLCLTSATSSFPSLATSNSKMANDNITVDTSLLENNKLTGKSNYLDWRRHFDRVAKASDVWDICTKKELILSEPKEEDHIYYSNPQSTSKAGADGVPVSSRIPETQQQIDVQKSLFVWQAAYRRWERQKGKIRLAKNIILKSISSSIAHEVEDITSPADQLQHIKNTCGISDEYARSVILEKMVSLKLEHCDSMCDYLDKHRDLKVDLVRSRQPFGDSQLATNIINGLPNSYKDFIRLWDFHRSQHIGKEPDLHFLCDRLLIEEANHKKSKGKTKTPDKSDKQNLVCTHKNCGKTGHTEEDCWIAHPDKMPQRIKDKANKGKSQSQDSGAKKNNNNSSSANSKPPEGIVAMIQGHPNPFHPLQDESSFSSMFSNPEHLSSSTDLNLQTGDHESEDLVWGEDYSGNEFGTLAPVCSENSHMMCTTMSDNTARRDVVLLDSGADICVFNDKKWFLSIEPIETTVSSAEDGHLLFLQGGGTVRLLLQTPLSDCPTPLTIVSAAYAPKAKYNIVSLSYLTQRAQLHGSWNNNRISILQDDLEVGSATLCNGLYHMDLASIPDEAKMDNFVGTVNFDHPVWVWHRRLGHLGLQNMINLLDISTGIPLTKQQIRSQMSIVCPVCAVTRSLVKIPRDPATRRQTQPGGLIHCDVWGPYSIPGLGGVKFFFFATDDATRFTWHKSFTSKSELPAVFQQNHLEIETGLGITIRGYRFDGEFYLGPIGAWLTQRHVPFEPTVPYAHYMGGAHERVNRIIREKAAPMIQELSISGQISKIITEHAVEKIKETTLPKNLWPEAIKYSVFLKNRSPTRALKDKKTPWEALYNSKPHFYRESTWGSRVYVTLPPEKARWGQPKLHNPRGWVGYFVGCEGEAIFRIYSPEHLTVFRVGMARVQQGQGLDDPQDEQSCDGCDDHPDEDSLQYDPVPGSACDAQNLEDVDALAERLWLESSDEGDDSDILSDAASDASRYFDPPADECDLALEHSERDPEPSLAGAGQADNPSSSPVVAEEETVSRFFAGVISKDNPQSPPPSSTASNSALDPSEGITDKPRQIREGFEAEKPCAECYARAGRDCRYTVQAGLMIQIYPVTEASKKKLETMPEDECYDCFRQRTIKKRNREKCDNSQPCRSCVHISTYSYIHCVFRVDDHFESYGTQPFELDEQSRIVLKENWEDLTCHALSKARSQKASETKKLKPFKPTIPSAKTLDLGHVFTSAPLDEMAYDIIPTSAFGLECGLHALIHSITSQLPDHLPPSLDDLRRILSSDEMRHRTAPSELAVSLGHSNLLVDQVAGVLQLWGQSRGLNLQLGVIHEGEDSPTTIIFPTEGYTTVWIHNDGASLRNSARYNHYSGVHIQTTSIIEEPPSRPSFSVLKRKRSDDDVDADIAAFSSKIINALSSSESELPPEPTSFAAAMRSSERESWIDAMSRERASLVEEETFDVVSVSEMPEDYQPLQSKWVYKRKFDRWGNVRLHKARLVAKGFLQKEGIDYNETFSGVIKSTSFRIIFAIAALKDWRVWMMDVVTAFLNGVLKEKIYMKPPPGWNLPKGTIFRLRKTLYGLKQAPREWYAKFWSTIREWGFRRSEYDNCVFIHDEWQVILGIWVDDSLILAPNELAADKLKTKLTKAFKMKDEGLCDYYLGMQVVQDDDGVSIHHKTYVDQMLQKFDMTRVKTRKVPMNPGTNLTLKEAPEDDPAFVNEYQQKVGSIVYLAGKSRPDISFAANYTARFMSKPSRDHMDEVDGILAYLKHTLRRGYKYKRGTGKLNLSGFVDADFAGCIDTRRSTTGWVFMLAGAPISWASQRQRTVSLSTTDAEYVAASEAAKEAIWIRGFVNDLNLPDMSVGAVPLYIDNEGARKLTRNPEFHNRTKYIDIRYNFIRERVIETEEIDTRRVDTKFNIADILTKPLARLRLEELSTMMGMIDIPEEPQADDEGEDLSD